MITLVIGNGFDIDLGLNTRYSDFAKSEYWPRMSVCPIGLELYLNERKGIECWFDLEQCLLDYCKSGGGYAESNKHFLRIDEDLAFYNTIRSQLSAYLKNEQSKTLNKASHAAQLLKNLLKEEQFDNIFSFNYTDIRQIGRRLGTPIPNDIVCNYVHGSIEKDDIILGVDESDVIKGYETMQKAVDVNYHSTNIISELAHSNEVIFFGHSFGTIDIEYFRPYFMHIFNQDILEDANHPQITIFTYNEASRIQILKNIHDMNVNRQRLFNLCDFRIFKTDGSDDQRIAEYYDEKSSSRSLWEGFRV